MTDTPPTVLVIEDEAKMRTFVNIALSAYGYRMLEASTAADGIRQAVKHQPDLVLLDLGLPDVDGSEVTRRIREWSRIPILVISARGREEHKVKALDEGADDYLTKPYAYTELLARIEALARRPAPEEQDTRYSVGDLSLDRLSHKVTRAGETIPLQPREFRLLEYLMKHAGQVVTRTMLLENVWDYHFDPQTNVIDVHISRLRGKIDKGLARPLLHTVRGAGYMIRDGAD